MEESWVKIIEAGMGSDQALTRLCPSPPRPAVLLLPTLLMCPASSSRDRNLLPPNLNLNQEKHLLRKNRQQRLAKVLKGRRRRSRKLGRKVPQHRLKMVTLKLKRSTSLAQLLMCQPPEAQKTESVANEGE
ncbi:hypothetical protein Celaphus_00018762 [Cervus elaphus hippelaphus]|uniref:Uncharacterized protein n=1 Tax=Cervus elaphus hippelaphus TaxID=46360 RepID=A0A212C5X8_CEREH|nr:hypothetical protein Celaphus_00018762 [Cervus elaphus hippelaphus]